MKPIVALVFVLFAFGAGYVALGSVPLAFAFASALGVWVGAIFLWMRVLGASADPGGVPLTLAAAVGCAVVGTVALFLSSTTMVGVLGLVAALLFSISAVAQVSRNHA